MNQKKIVALTVFRKLSNGSIIALFPKERWNEDSDFCASYTLAGEHAPADYDEVFANSTQPTRQELEPLKKELEALGYHINLQKKVNLKPGRARWAAKPGRG